MRLPLAFLLASAATAHADQCEVLDSAVAERAMHELEAHPHYVPYCAPCGDKAPGEPAVAGYIKAGPHGVEVDGKPIDLAYIYVQVSEAAYSNLAALAGCATTDVPPSLRVDAATASGVMIRPSDDPITQTVAEAEPEPEPAIEPPAEPDPPTVYVIHESGTPAWLIAVLAAGGTSGAWGSLALVRRRRRAFKPRAIELE